MKWSCILVMYLALCSCTCYGQEKPTLTLDWFNYSRSLRQSVCERQAQIDNSTLQHRNALSGLNLSTCLYMDNRYFRFDEDGAIDAEYPGLIGVLMDELAKRGGFAWRNSFGIFNNSNLPEDRDFSDLLGWTVWAYDISAAHWSKTIDRIAAGVTYPEGWYDGRMIMIGINDEDSQLDVWSFLEPFSTGVWGMIIVTIVVSALVYWFLDWFDTDSDELRLGNDPAQNLFLTAITFTGQFEFKPTSNSARIFTASLAFWSLIMMSAYTANLASFLVVQNTPSITIDSVGDAVRHNYPICVFGKTAQDDALTNTYPEARIVRTSSEEASYQGVNEGRCKVLLTSKSAWHEYESDRSVNGECQLAWIGRSFQEIEGGFATKSDSGTLCTSLVRDVLNLHMVEMKDDGFVARAWEDYFKKQATIDCKQASPTEDDDESNGQLSLQSMGGTFIIHYITTAFAIFLALCGKLYASDRCRRKAPASQVVSNGATNNNTTEASWKGNSPEYSDVQSNTQVQVEEMLKKQNEQLSALSEQNAAMLAMINAMKGESSARTDVHFHQGAGTDTSSREGLSEEVE